MFSQTPFSFKVLGVEKHLDFLLKAEVGECIFYREFLVQMEFFVSNSAKQDCSGLSAWM